MHPKRCGEEDYVINASVEHVWEEDHSHYGDVSSFCSLTSRQYPRRMLLVQWDGDIQGVAMTKQNLVSDLEAATPRRLALPRMAQSCLTIPMLATCFEVFVMRLWHGLELCQNPMWGKLSTLQFEVCGEIMLVVPL
jgi:hypothetical protein